MNKYHFSGLTVLASLTFSVAVLAQNPPQAPNGLNVALPSAQEAGQRLAAPVIDEAVEEVVLESSVIDYSGYNEFMKKYAAKKQGRPKLAYELIKENAAEDLQGHIDFMASHDVSTFSETEQLAFWLNLQNALVVHAITTEDKRRRDLKRQRGSGSEPGKMWTKPRVQIAGQKLSIAQIDSYIIETFDNPNVIYGLYQGVRGGPCINDVAYIGPTVEATLEKNAKRYINARGIVHVNNDTVELTPVFLWHKDQAFGTDDANLVAHLQNHAEPNLKSALYRAARFEPIELNYGVDYFDVDKELRDRSAAAQPAKRRSTTPQPAPRLPQPTGGGGYGS